MLLKDQMEEKIRTNSEFLNFEFPVGLNFAAQVLHFVPNILCQTHCSGDLGNLSVGVSFFIYTNAYFSFSSCNLLLLGPGYQ